MSSAYLANRFDSCGKNVRARVCACFSITNKIIYTVDWKRFRSFTRHRRPRGVRINKKYPPHAGCQPPPFHHRITIIIVSTPSPHPRGPFPTWPFVIFNGVLLLIPPRRVPAQNIIIRVCTIYSRLLLFSFFSFPARSPVRAGLLCNSSDIIYYIVIQYGRRRALGRLN